MRLMRPAILNPLFADATTLAGVGPKVAKLLATALHAVQASPRVKDLAFHLPSSFIDRSYRPTLRSAQSGRIATVTVNILEYLPGRSARQPFRIIAADDTAAMEIVFFTGNPDHIKTRLPLKAPRLLSGRIDRFAERLQMVHPDYIVAPDNETGIPEFDVVYRTTEGLPPRSLQKLVRRALGRLPEFPEWQDFAWRERNQWRDFKTALLALHAPHSESELSPMTPARQRLAYDELLASQLALALIRNKMRSRTGRALRSRGVLRNRAIAALPFRLTQAQIETISEITTAMESPTRMLRLLQGDVGSGKTVVAMAALLNAVEAGCQGALMAPTEILARQHLASLGAMAEAANVRIALLTGRERGTAREALLGELASGKIDILIGTHAIFYDQVQFRDLGLAVVDEQHRFGVHQRMQLQGKGEAPADVLVMTATPIPRTLQLTAYGDMQVSRLTSKPVGRKPVVTRAIPLSRLDAVIIGLKRPIAKDQRCFWICPLVEESEVLDLAAAEQRAATLRKRFGSCVGLVHGKMRGAERDLAMRAFQSGETRILVATTVIEVGVDIPEAAIMVIEHAERFGLAQLHQLRGRVGRGGSAATCLLLYQEPIGAIARERLSILRRTEDGFVIAEEDLRLRGAGEVLGTKQSGLPDFCFADLAQHQELLAAAHDDARLILERDGELTSPRGIALRTLLYLFDRDEAVRYLRAG
jgi:ATP-dependent DNA helicase RecG